MDGLELGALGLLDCEHCRGARCWDGSARFLELRRWMIKVGGASKERGGSGIDSENRTTAGRMSVSRRR